MFPIINNIIIIWQKFQSYFRLIGGCVIDSGPGDRIILFLSIVILFLFMNLFPLVPKLSIGLSAYLFIYLFDDFENWFDKVEMCLLLDNPVCLVETI